MDDQDWYDMLSSIYTKHVQGQPGRYAAAHCHAHASALGQETRLATRHIMQKGTGTARVGTVWLLIHTSLRGILASPPDLL